MHTIAKCSLLVLVVTILGLSSAYAFVGLRDRGEWPEDWPKELEPFRDRAKTAESGIPLAEETIYQIPFDTRDEFERIWPILLGLKSQGAPVTLLSVDEHYEGYGGPEWSNSRPLVRIRAPHRGGFGTLSCGPPWPDYLRDARGDLPEFVHTKQIDGELQWVRGKGELERIRCRIELEIVVDGEIIDVDRLEMPEDVTLIDRRSKPDPES